jgi:DNA-binding NarL/FixJ family response regulator
MPRMMVDIVRDSIAHHEDIDVVGEVDGEDGLLDAARMMKADVILLAATDAADSGAYDALLYQRPRLKILTITADGRYAFLHQLMPDVMPLGEVSASVLVDAIRRRSQVERAGAGHG